MTVNLIENNVPIDELEKVLNLLEETNIELIIDENGQRTYLNGTDVSKRIRMPDVNALVSPVSAIKEIREKLVLLQREFATNKDIVMEGRDITTVVFPNADVKIYLTADQNERATRRYKEMLEKGIDTTYEEVYESIKKRDENDINKEYGALKIAEDAIVIDSTKMTIEDVYEEVKKVILSKMDK